MGFRRRVGPGPCPWVPIIRSWALTRGFALHPGTRNRYEIRDTRPQHRPASPQVNDHGRVSGTHTLTCGYVITRQPRTGDLFLDQIENIGNTQPE